MKTLFLDIDGVLNSWETFKQSPERIYVLDPQMIDYLNTIVELSGCQVVLSSTWRLNKEGLHFVQKKLNNMGFLFTLCDETPNLRIKDRGHEIQAWMDEHNVVAEDIVILDDDADMAHLLPRLVQTSMEEGLKPIHVAQALTLFKEGTCEEESVPSAAEEPRRSTQNA